MSYVILFYFFLQKMSYITTQSQEIFLKYVIELLNNIFYINFTDCHLVVVRVFTIKRLMIDE